MSGVLVISPHPDDDVIGCGGTLRKRVLQGDTVHIVYLTSGEKGGHGRSPQETASIREEEARAAAEIMGFTCLDFWREPDGALRATQANVRRLSGRIAEWQPHILYVPHHNEMHPDHRAAARMVMRALATSTLVKPLVHMYEVWTPLTVIDQVEDISECMELKLSAIRAHKSQCDVMRFDAAICGLNRYRGEMHSWPGGDYAEVFTRMRI